MVLAEGVSGSIEKFADDMNAASRRLGMTQSSWVNPNGLPADEQITSARDMAMLARAILRELPEYEMYWHIPAIRFGRRVMRNTNGLIGRYPEADGMKTGFICASGFNVVATATRGDRKLIVVVFGSRSGAVRSEKAAQLFEKGFSSGGLSWLMPSLGSVDALQPIAAAPPNLRDEMCGKHRKRPAAEEADDEEVGGEQQRHRPELGLCGDGAEPARRPYRARADSRPLLDHHAADPGLGRNAPRRGADAGRDHARQEAKARDGDRRHRTEAGREDQAGDRRRRTKAGREDQAGDRRRRTKAGREDQARDCQRIGRRIQPDPIGALARARDVHAGLREGDARAGSGREERGHAGEEEDGREAEEA